jgi:hypothetical protein
MNSTLVMNLLMMGAVSMAFAVAGLFFFRFWKETGDRLFALFALAFVVLAVNRIGLALATDLINIRDSLYWVRLLAFSLILIAILDKNRGQKAARTEPPGK